MNPIAVPLYPNEIATFAERKYLRLYGIDDIDPKMPEFGRSHIPDELAPIFCREEDNHNFPEYYTYVRNEEEGRWEWENSDKWRDGLWLAYRLRYVPDHWTVSDGAYLHVFLTEADCVAWLHTRRDFNGYTVRTPSGEEKKIQVAIQLV